MRVFKRRWRDKRDAVGVSAKYTVAFHDHNGCLRTVVCGTDKGAATDMGRSFERLASFRAARMRPDPDLQRWLEILPPKLLEQMKDWDLLSGDVAGAGKPLAGHLEDFKHALEATGGTTTHAQKTYARAKKLLDACGFRNLSDIEAARVQTELADMRRDRRDARGRVTPGISAQTSNYYLAAIKQFFHWLVCERRVTDSPLTHLQPLNARADRRRERRALTADECRHLLVTTEASVELRYGMRGPDRAALYQLALETGLRWSELRSLTRGSFELDGDRPAITVSAAYSKHRREDTLPLYAKTAHFMGDYLANCLPVAAAFPMPASDQGAKILQADLKAARIAWIKAARGDREEVKRRVKADFLKDRDAAGCVVDFHSLRHTFATRLMEAGVNPKVIQMLMRHSTITLTMDRYTHLSVLDQRGALETLPNLDSDDAEAMRATGTDGAADQLTVKLTVARSERGRHGPLLAATEGGNSEGCREHHVPETQSPSCISGALEDGGPTWIRTRDQGIMSPLL